MRSRTASNVGLLNGWNRLTTVDLVKKQREEGETEGEVLKEMELSSSGLSSTVIQIYWNNVLSCYFHANETVRTETMQVCYEHTISMRHA